jgi:hypothetical protein
MSSDQARALARDSFVAGSPLCQLEFDFDRVKEAYYRVRTSKSE